MLNRKVSKNIDDWYQNKTCGLLIDGARQIGKTTVIEAYLEDNNIDYIEINLLENKQAVMAFNSAQSSDQLLLWISALGNKELIPNKTVIFIDEIQEASDAITPIKFLVKDSPYRFIFSGSLLGVKMKNIASIPVGYLQIIQMYPMDFEEFIDAHGVSKKIKDNLLECFENRKEVDGIINNQMMSLFRTYLAVGGMPQAVKTLIETKDINAVNSVLKDINDGYLLDIAKYSENELLIQDIYNLIPSELNNQNKRFILKKLNEKARFYNYETSFTWLNNSGIGLFVHNVDKPIYPLLASKERTLFKLFFNDIGLLSYRLYSGNQIQLLVGDTNNNYGAIYEAVVAQELKCHGFDLYYNSDKKRGEIDFLIEKDMKVIPLEVKSGKGYKRHSALTQLLSNKDFHINEGYVLTNSNVCVEENRIYLPIYMIMFIKQNIVKEKQLINIDISKLI